MFLLQRRYKRLVNNIVIKIVCNNLFYNVLKAYEARAVSTRMYRLNTHWRRVYIFRNNKQI